LKLQLVSTPDLHIIDYGVGLPGSQHDATAWAATRVPQEHDVLLEEGEFVWGDSAYPLKKWCQAPYKRYAYNQYTGSPLLIGCI
jgi:DDE superfamily endonuclease